MHRNEKRIRQNEYVTNEGIRQNYRRTSEVEIDNLPDKEFKVMFIKMRKELMRR